MEMRIGLDYREVRWGGADGRLVLIEWAIRSVSPICLLL